MIEPKNCALIIGLTYFFSAILSLVLKNLIGRRILLLMSQLGMAVSQIALGVYFYVLAQKTPLNLVYDKDSKSSDSTVNNITYVSDEEDYDVQVRNSWIPLPLIMIFTTAFNLGLGSLTWVVATEVRILN